MPPRGNVVTYPSRHLPAYQTVLAFPELFSYRNVCGLELWVVTSEDSSWNAEMQLSYSKPSLSEVPEIHCYIHHLNPPEIPNKQHRHLDIWPSRHVKQQGTFWWKHPLVVHAQLSWHRGAFAGYFGTTNVLEEYRLPAASPQMEMLVNLCTMMRPMEANVNISNLLSQEEASFQLSDLLVNISNSTLQRSRVLGPEKVSHQSHLCTLREIITWKSRIFNPSIALKVSCPEVGAVRTAKQFNKEVFPASGFFFQHENSFRISQPIC